MLFFNQQNSLDLVNQRLDQLERKLDHKLNSISTTLEHLNNEIFVEDDSLRNRVLRMEIEMSKSKSRNNTLLQITIGMVITSFSLSAPSIYKVLSSNTPTVPPPQHANQSNL